MSLDRSILQTDERSGGQNDLERKARTVIQMARQIGIMNRANVHSSNKINLQCNEETKSKSQDNEEFTGVCVYEYVLFHRKINK